MGVPMDDFPLWHVCCHALQRLGALSECITAAYNATRAEVQASSQAVLPGKSLPPASPLLAAALEGLARGALAAGRDACARAARLGAAGQEGVQVSVLWVSLRQELVRQEC